MESRQYTLHIETNMDEIIKKVEELQKKMEEANSIIEELASMNLEVYIDI